MTSSAAFVVVSVTLKVSAPYASSSSIRMTDGSRSSVNNNGNTDARRQHQRNRGGGRGLVLCSYHKTISPSDADCSARRCKRAEGNAYFAATVPSRIEGICSDYDLPEEDDHPERPYIFFTATEVHPTAAVALVQSHSEETWPLSSLSASRP